MTGPVRDVDIAGRAVFFVTRPGFVSRQRAHRLALRSAAIPQAGKPRPGSIAVYGLGGAVRRIRRGDLLAQWKKLDQRGVQQLSEIGFLRAVGLMPEAPAARLIESAEFARLSGLDDPTLRSLAIAGALEAEDDGFPFRDLRLGREIARLLGRGHPLAGIAEAAALARRHEGATIAAAGGEIEVRLNEAEIEMSGQTVLPFDAPAATLDEVLDDADEAEQGGDLPTARRLYEIAVMARPRDAVVRYNLGCVLTGLSELDAAETHFRIALSLDPGFAEAAFNAAHVRRLKGDAEGERQFLEAALEADPDYVDALVALARWLIARDRFAEVRRLLERIERVGAPEAHADFVRKATLLCRLADQA